MNQVFFGLLGWALAIFVLGMSVGAWLMYQSVKKHMDDAIHVLRLAEKKGIKLR